MVKKMKLGLLDPMKSLHSLYSDVDASVKIAEETKLENIRLMLLVDSRFKEVILNADKTKLIIRGDMERGEEAFTFIRWDMRKGGTSHHAVISSANESFRDVVIDAMKALKSSDSQGHSEDG